MTCAFSVYLMSADSEVLVAQVKGRQEFIAKREDVPVSQVPADAVTASASGLDPAKSTCPP